MGRNGKGRLPNALLEKDVAAETHNVKRLKQARISVNIIMLRSISWDYKPITSCCNITIDRVGWRVGCWHNIQWKKSRFWMNLWWWKIAVVRVSYVEILLRWQVDEAKVTSSWIKAPRFNLQPLQTTDQRTVVKIDNAENRSKHKRWEWNFVARLRKVITFLSGNEWNILLNWLRKTNNCKLSSIRMNECNVTTSACLAIAHCIFEYCYH